MFMRRRQYTTSRRTQSGVAALMAAVLLFSMVAFMALVTDTGRLYFEKRSQQKNTDLAALETALRYCRTRDDLALVDNAREALVRNSFDGNFQDGGDSTLNVTLVGDNSVEVAVVRQTAPSLFQRMMNLDQDSILLTTIARAKACEPTAQLAIRSSLVSLDSSQSELLNPILGGLLGTTLNLTAADWNGILDTNINLLSYMDALASELNIDLGDYDSVLASDISISELIDISTSVLESGGSTAFVDIDAVNQALDVLQADIPDSAPLVRIGEVLNLQSGSEEAGLDANIQIFDIIQSSIQLASEDNVANINLPVSLPGLAAVSVQAKIIEPQQLSPIGNPETDEIYVRSSQVRTLVEVDLSAATNAVSNLVDALSPLLDPVVNFLNNVGFSEKGLIGSVVNLLDDVFAFIITVCGDASLLGTECPEANVTYLEVAQEPLQISLDAGSAEALLSPDGITSNYRCENGDKELSPIELTTAAIHARIGNIDSAAAFSSDASPSVDPYPLVEIGYKKVKPRSCIEVLGLGDCEDELWEQDDGSWLLDGKSTAKKYVMAGLGLKVDASLLGSGQGTSVSKSSPNLPEVKDPCLAANDESACYEPIDSDISLADPDIEIVAYSSSTSGVLGAILGTQEDQGLLSDVFTAIIDTLQGANGLLNEIVGLIVNPTTDPITGDQRPSLLQLLGADIAGAELGAALTCENDTVRLSR